MTLDETGYTSSEDDDNSRSGQYQSIKHLRPAPSSRTGGVKAGDFTAGMEYSDSSDVYCTGNSESLGAPRYPAVSTTAKRSLEDRVRDYTGQTLRQDERLEHPAGSSSGRSSDSRSPFLDGHTSRNKRRGGGRGGGEIMMSDQYETPHIPQTMRGDTIWETKLDQEYLSYVPISAPVRPDLVLANTLSTHQAPLNQSGLTEEPTNYLPQPEETVVMPGFPVQTLATSLHPPPYSPHREKNPFQRPCLFHCSWKVVAVSLTVLTLLLSSVIVYFGAVKFPTSEPPPLPNSVIDSSGLHDLTNNCIPQQEQPSPDYHWTDSPELLQPDQWVKTRLGPRQLWLAKLTVSRESLHQFNITIIEGGQSLAVFGRHMDYPSVTKHDWVEYILSENRRFVSEAKSVSSVLSEGSWYLGIYNDAETEVELGLVTSLQVSGVECPDCGSHGRCEAGLCQCDPQWTGETCQASLCPVLCSGHGHYGGGRCHCQQGWKGEECEVRHDECEVADCSGQGACVAGLCQCQPGWTGTSCQQRDCLDRTCSQHGTCSEGVCYCHLGWMGESCEERNLMIQPCLPDCSNHGTFDINLGQCRCSDGWTGPQCNLAVCGLDCGPHGACQAGACLCEQGWGGHQCQLQLCHPSCEKHGQCVNGSCICQQGWNGRHCSLEGCVNGCGGHGECRQVGAVWGCRCQDGWGGENCERRQETDCQDEIDNDKDGLVDCGDSNCCSHPACKENIMCVYFADPVDVLLRKPPPPPSAGFFAKVRFLIEGDKSVQSYSKPESYDERRASVIRGRVLTSAGEGIIGVRVSVDRSRGASNYGFTLTRPGGWFDLLVNGGGAVTLQFQRSPFKPLTRTSYIPWNQIYVIDPVVMASNGGAGISWEEEDSSLQLQYSQPCLAHSSTIRPALLSQAGLDRAVPSHPASQQISQSVLVPSGHLLQSISIPGTKIHLVYDSSAASSSLSTIKMLLTPRDIPSSLYRIHVKTVVAGVVVTQLLEAEESLVYTYSWDKRNVYNQKVYGRTEARISVGYQYRECAAIVWETQTMSLPGYPVDITNIGGWNIDIHHHFDPFQGILQKGDGSRLDFSQLSKIIEPLMGNARQRDFQCEKSKCQGEARALSLLNVVSMTTGPDGSIFVGDYNLIRKIDPQGNVFTILEFSSAQGSFLYEISISPADDSIYMTNSERHQVWRLLKLSDVSSPGDNYEVVAGTGQRCVPGAQDHCGDGGPAIQARLAFPKGLAVSVDRSVYISDGKTVRIVNQNGKISTLIGGHSPNKHLVPIGCDTTYLADDVELHWPTNIALSPLDSSLHIVDDSQVLRLTPDLKLQVIAGSSLRCSSSHRSESNRTRALNMRLGPIVDIGFAQNGDLYIGEKSVSNDYVLHNVRRDGQVENIVGRQSDVRHSDKVCLCEIGNCTTCSSSGGLMANQVIFKALSAFTISPEGTLHVADNRALQIFSIRPLTPSLNTAGNYQIVHAGAMEIYTFNKFGQHLLTQNIQTGATKQEFEYSKSLGFGKLLKVSDSIGNKILLQRDYTHRVQFLENTFGQKYSTKINPLGKLESVQISSRKEVKFAYNQNDFLLKSVSVTSGELYSYSYSPSGRVVTAVSPTGEWLALGEDESCLVSGLTIPSRCFTVHLNGELALNLSSSGNTEQFSQDSACGPKLITESLQLDWSDGSCSSRRLSSVDVSSSALGVEDGLMRLPSEQTILRGNTVARLSLQSSWENSNLNGNAIFLNDSQRVAGMLYDKTTNKMRISGEVDSSVVLEVSLERGMLPVAWNYLGKVSCNSSYDSYGRLTTNLCGNSREEYIFNAKDENLYSRSHCNGRETKFMYENHELPRETRLASGRVVTYIYDSYGGLEQVMMPLGTRYGFWRQNGFGVTKIGYQLPGYSEPYVTKWDVGGRLVEVRPPGGDGMLLTSYTGAGQVARLLAGDRKSDFQYSSGLLTSVQHQRDGVSIKTSFQYSQDNYYVVTDTVGSPILFFSPDGSLSKEVSRSPYGHVTYDSNPSIRVPIGLFGGIQDDDTGLIHIQDSERKSVYDPFLGSFLTPDWSNLHKYIHQPERFLLYRINGNDPLNSPKRAKQSDLNQQLEKVMEVLGQSYPIFKTSELTSTSRLKEENVQYYAPPAPFSAQSSLPLVSSSAVNFLNQANWLHSIFKPWSSSLLVRGVVEPEIMFSSQEAILGNFIVLSKHGDTVSVSSGPDASNIYSNVFSTVLNNSMHVEFESSSHGLDNYYFTKRESWRATDDIAQLRRLSSNKINLTVHESQYESSKVMDVRVHLSNSVLNIRYGTEPGRERTRLVRHAGRVVARRAWAREQDRVSGAVGGEWSHQWRDSQVKQILSGTGVEGWDIEYRHSPALHYSLASDLDNVILVRTNKRRSRH